MNILQIGGLLLLTVPCAVVDFRTRKLPPVWITGLALAGILFCGGQIGWHHLGINSLVAMCFLVISLITHGAIGIGDALLRGACGCFMTWASMLEMLLLALIFAAGVSATVLIAGRGNRKTAIPFAPCLLLAAAFQICAGWLG